MATQTIIYPVIDQYSYFFENDPNDPLLNYEIEVDSTQDKATNKSEITVRFYVKALKKLTIYNSEYYFQVQTHDNVMYWYHYAFKVNGKSQRYEEFKSDLWNSDDDDTWTLLTNQRVLLGTEKYTVSHAADGTCKLTFTQAGIGTDTSSRYSMASYDTPISEEEYSIKMEVEQIKGEEKSIDLPIIPPIATVLTATAFTDEENPVITYKNPAGSSVTTLQACIASYDGKTIYAAYRDISKTGTSYTFNLTSAERNTLRAAAANSKTINVAFYIKTVISGKTYTHYLHRVLTIVNCNPTITNITIADANSTTAALTGDINKLIRYESMAEYQYTVAASKSATIVSQYVQNGSKKITGLSQGVIDDVESGLFTFGATDSRGLTSEVSIEKTIVDYVKPTCYQVIELSMTSETGAQAKITATGNYFNGSFGAVANTIKVEYRMTNNDGVMGSWTTIAATPTFNNGTYTVSTTVSGLSYSTSYTFQCRITDKLNQVISAQYTTRLMPIFDWGEADFNFNVPVNITATSATQSVLNMNGETVIRHTGSSTNNTVLSGSGGHIYIRPGGTNDTSSEARLTSTGNLELKGDLIVNGVNIIAALEKAGII